MATLVMAQTYQMGTEITVLSLPPAMGGDLPVVYTLSPALPSGLNFNAATREITGTPDMATAEATYTLTATDADGDTATLDFTITVAADLAPDFGLRTVAARTYQMGTEITALTLPPAMGGDLPVVYTLSPALPSGLNFNAATREITGTPDMATAEATYTLTATDADGDTATLDFTITVAADLAPDFGLRTVAARTYQMGTEITALTLPPAMGGDLPVVYTLSPALPSGLNFNAATREITGTPDMATAEAPYTLTATDADGDTATLDFTITVNAAGAVSVTLNDPTLPVTI